MCGDRERPAGAHMLRLAESLRADPALRDRATTVLVRVGAALEDGVMQTYLATRCAWWRRVEDTARERLRPAPRVRGHIEDSQTAVVVLTRLLAREVSLVPGLERPLEDDVVELFHLLRPDYWGRGPTPLQLVSFLTCLERLAVEGAAFVTSAPPEHFPGVDDEVGDDGVQTRRWTTLAGLAADTAGARHWIFDAENALLAEPRAVMTDDQSFLRGDESAEALVLFGERFAGVVDK